jgi:hypothetical protein
MKSVEILIPNRFSWDSICLTIESILKRTTYKGEWSIFVVDNSLADNRFACEPHERKAIDGDDGNRRAYLLDLAAESKIKLVFNVEQDRKYGHGENLRVLCDNCRADYGFLLNSTSEVLRGDWIDVMVDALRDPEHDLGVARFRDGGNHFDKCWITPNYWPNIMLLDMRLYRKHFPGHRWELRQVGAEMFERPEVFYGMTPPRTPERTPPLVFADTGWSLYEKLRFDNPEGLRMLPLPDDYWRKYISWRGGIDRNSHRPDHEHVRGVLAEVKVALERLRSE